MYAKPLTAAVSLVGLVTVACAQDDASAVDPAGSSTTEAAKSVESQRKTCTINAENGDKVCYDTFTEAVAAVTGGRITNAPADSKTAANDRELTALINKQSARGAASGSADGVATAGEALQDIGDGSTIVAIFWEDCGYSGASSIVHGTAPCTPSKDDVDYAWSWVGSRNNDEWSSFKGYNNCWAQLFSDINFTGDLTDYMSSWECFWPWAPVYNDEISSFQLT